jgi:hypothetical protein
MAHLLSRPSRRGFYYLVYVLLWIAGSLAIGIPVLRGLSAILNALDPLTRALFYLMPAFLSGLLVLGVLQIISMYRYWFGQR